MRDGWGKEWRVPASMEPSRREGRLLGWMSASPNPARNPRDAAAPGGPPAVPPGPNPADLGPGEEGVARWFAEEDPWAVPPSPPEELETLVLDAYAEELGGSVVGGPVAGRRSRAWHGALAAVVVVLVGVAGLIWASRDAARRADVPRADVQPPPPVIVDDPTVPLYPGMETFDGSGPGGAGDEGAVPAPPEVR